MCFRVGFNAHRVRVKVLIYISLFFFFFTFLLVILRNSFSTNTIRLHPAIINNNTKLKVEIVRTDHDKTIGLSDREKIENNQGMLFVYDRPAYYSFWMKGMKFDIDFIWINNKRIVDVTENVSHLDQQNIYLPRMPADQVLEVKAGLTRKNGIKIGDKIE